MTFSYINNTFKSNFKGLRTCIFIDRLFLNWLELDLVGLVSFSMNPNRFSKKKKKCTVYCKYFFFKFKIQHAINFHTTILFSILYRALNDQASMKP